MPLLMAGSAATLPALTLRMAARAAIFLVALIEPVAFPLMDKGLFFL